MQRLCTTLLAIILLSSCAESFHKSTYRSLDSISPNHPEKNSHIARFQLVDGSWKNGVRLAEFRTSQIDMTYRVLEANANSILFKVYISNISNSPYAVDSSLFNITSWDSQKRFPAANPSTDVDEDNKSMYLTKTVLQPGESAGGRLQFLVKNTSGRWTLKNKLSAAHSFNFEVTPVTK